MIQAQPRPGPYREAVVTKSTGLRTAERRPPWRARPHVAGAERPRTRLRPVLAAAGVADFGTRPVEPPAHPWLTQPGTTTPRCPNPWMPQTAQPPIVCTPGALRCTIS